MSTQTTTSAPRSPVAGRISSAASGPAVTVRSAPHSCPTTYWGSRSELVEVLDLGARGLIRPRTTTFRLDEATDAYRRMAAGELEGRAVILP